MTQKPVKDLTIADIEAIVPSSNQAPLFAVEQFKEMVADAVSSTEYTGGVDLIEDKDVLVNVPFAVTEYRLIESDKSSEPYVNVRITLPNMQVVCFNDGGVGIPPVCDDHAKAVGFLPTVDENGDEVQPEPPAEGSKIVGGGIFKRVMFCKRGLQKSVYDTEVNGRLIKDAVTYYFT